MVRSLEQVALFDFALCRGVFSLRANNNLESILLLILQVDDPAFQRDLLKGMHDGLTGLRKVVRGGRAINREPCRGYGLVPYFS